MLLVESPTFTFNAILKDELIGSDRSNHRPCIGTIISMQNDRLTCPLLFGEAGSLKDTSCDKSLPPGLHN